MFALLEIGRPAAKSTPSNSERGVCGDEEVEGGNTANPSSVPRLTAGSSRSSRLGRPMFPSVRRADVSLRGNWP